jgi:hypothetical protein
VALYAAAHPRSWAVLKPVLETTLAGDARTVPVVEFDVSQKRGA